MKTSINILAKVNEANQIIRRLGNTQFLPKQVREAFGQESRQQVEACWALKTISDFLEELAQSDVTVLE